MPNPPGGGMEGFPTTPGIRPAIAPNIPIVTSENWISRGFRPQLLNGIERDTGATNQAGDLIQYQYTTPKGDQQSLYLERNAFLLALSTRGQTPDHPNAITYSGVAYPDLALARIWKGMPLDKVHGSFLRIIQLDLPSPTSMLDILRATATELGISTKVDTDTLLSQITTALGRRDHMMKRVRDQQGQTHLLVR